MSAFSFGLFAQDIADWGFRDTAPTMSDICSMTIALSSNVFSKHDDTS